MSQFFIGDDQKLAEFLIHKGARVDATNNDGETPLHYSARSGKYIEEVPTQRFLFLNSYSLKNLS